MKRSISILSVLAFVLAFSGSALGQSENISATAQVITNIATDVAQDVNFGNIDPSLASTPTLDVTNGNTSNTDGAGQLGYVHVTSGEPDQSVTVEWNGGSNTTNLGRDGNPETIEWTIEVGSVGGNVTSGGGTDISSNNGTAGNVTLDGSGLTTLIFGGQLTGKSTTGDLPADTYTSGFGDGDVAVTISYDL
ncbi:hypothetical protein [Fodinibius sp. Rm-B-1B1-1]|uniref:hypothetical protein n=1 Tax=Fodinibius alkaliphilus TaxID=3140241 RepID=UPI00315A2224